MNDSVTYAISSVADGSMATTGDEAERRNNRQRFLSTHGIKPAQSVLVRLEYGGDDYRRYFEVTADLGGDGMTRPSSITADALFTRSKFVALFLPLGDCIAAVLHDPDNGVIGLSHLGRHNLEQTGGTASVRFMTEAFGTDPARLHVWLSAAAGREHYPLYDFGNRSLHEVALEQLLSAGVASANVSIDGRDTTTDDQLFSHSEFLKLRQGVDGRHAVVAMMHS